MKTEAAVSQSQEPQSEPPSLGSAQREPLKPSNKAPAPEALCFEPYEILHREDGSLWELGHGAMGVTYKAIDKDLHCPVALKIISTTGLESDEALQRFYREARSCAQLRHPNIASIFHLGKAQDGSPFYAMEFCEGPTLQQWVEREGPLSVPQALELGLQVSRALVMAEQAKVVHRDLKPSNLIVTQRSDEPMVIKIIDFGLAKIRSDSNSWSSVSGQGFVGTADFASPEQIEGVAVDTRSDIYSLGATFFYALTGRPMFEGTLARIITQHLTSPPPWERLPYLSQGVLGLLQEMLAKEPANRPASATLLRQRFEALLSREEEPKALPGDHEFATPAPRPSPTPIPAAAAAPLVPESEPTAAPPPKAAHPPVGQLKRSAGGWGIPWALLLLMGLYWLNHKAPTLPPPLLSPSPSGKFLPVQNTMRPLPSASELSNLTLAPKPNTPLSNLPDIRPGNVLPLVPQTSPVPAPPPDSDTKHLKEELEHTQAFLKAAQELAVRSIRPAPSSLPPIPSPSPLAPTITPWIFPDSNQRLLTESDLARLTTSQQARQAINELYARKGYIFKSPEGQVYARSLGNYYHPINGVDDDTIEANLSPVEKQNRDTLVQVRTQLKAREEP